jgi:1,4-dihydroxy-6-naphthoate synthase
MRLGYSFCPNDTFIFYALTHGKVPGFAVDEVLEDVETLNQWATEGRLELTKISYNAFFHVANQYVALRSGGALGRGVGPLVIAREPLPSLAGRTIAIPGELTTAYLLLRLSQPAIRAVPMRYDRIIPAIQAGEVDAGLIIHESRFTYQSQGMVKLQDLGEWWEGETGLPIPLGAILARRDLGEQRIRQLDGAVRASLQFAYDHPDQPAAYIRQHAAEMDEAVQRAHIATYVNDFSLDVGEEGKRAVEELYRRASRLDLIEPCSLPLFSS